MLNERIVASFIYVSLEQLFQPTCFIVLLIGYLSVLRFRKHHGIQIGVQEGNVGALGSFSRRQFLYADAIRYGQV